MKRNYVSCATIPSARLWSANYRAVITTEQHIKPRFNDILQQPALQ